MMKTMLLSGAVLALAVAAMPASAQLLGGSGGGSLGGALGGGSLGGIGGASSGSLGGMIDRTPVSTRGEGAATGRARADRSVDTRKGRASASGSATGGSALGGAGQLGSRGLSGGGSATGDLSGGVEAQAVGTDAVRGAAANGAGRVRGAADRARSAGASAADRVRSTSVPSGSGSAAGMASGSAAGNGASGSGSLALAGSGTVPVSAGMIVTDARGRAIGTVQSVRTSAQGAVERVLVKVGDRTADLPSGNFSTSGDALVSAMGKGEVRKAATAD